MNIESPIRYRLLAHNSDDLLIIEIIGQPYHLRKKPHEILGEPQLLDGFSNTDAAMIGVIAGMICERRNH
jgi:hypothetical protein